MRPGSQNLVRAALPDRRSPASHNAAQPNCQPQRCHRGGCSSAAPPPGSLGGQQQRRRPAHALAPGTEAAARTTPGTAAMPGVQEGARSLAGRGGESALVYPRSGRATAPKRPMRICRRCALSLADSLVSCRSLCSAIADCRFVSACQASPRLCAATQQPNAPPSPSPKTLPSRACAQPQAVFTQRRRPVLRPAGRRRLPPPGLRPAPTRPPTEARRRPRSRAIPPRGPAPVPAPPCPPARLAPPAPSSARCPPP